MTDQWRAGVWRTWQDVEQHLASGELRESHTLEFKRDDYPSTESGRKELAKDVAALALAGGVLIIGIDEDRSTGRATKLTPVALNGVVERIDQICAGRIQPPLAVTITDHLRDPDDIGRGLVIIEVPATGVPHMVDHRYVGRGNKTTRYLENPEVVRLLSSRDADVEALEGQLTDTYDSMRGQGLGAGCIVVVASLIPALRPDALRDFLTAEGWRDRLTQQMDAAAERIKELGGTSGALADVVDTNWSWFSGGANTRSPQRIPRGVGMPHSGSGKLINLIEVYESGAVRVGAEGVVTRSDGLEPTFSPRKAMSVAAQALAVAAGIAEVAGTRGSIGLGVLLGDTFGAYADPLHGWSGRNGRIRDDRSPYRDTEYRQTAITTTVALSADLTPAMDALFGPLLRALDFGDPLRTKA